MQEDDVPIRRFLQDATRKNIGIFSECVKGPNSPGNIFQPTSLKVGRQKRMAQTNRRAKQARRGTATAANAFRATLNLSPQTTGHKETK
jgi:hypothetical protein